MNSTNRYAKMSYGEAASHKTAGRSRDFSTDPQSLPETDARRSISESHYVQDHQISSTSTAEAEDNNEAIASKTSLVQVLRRNCSISSSSSSSYRFHFDDKQQSSFLETAAKKVFSLRRCSSVSSDRYCRIHDQTVTTLSSSSTIYEKDDGDGDDEAIAIDMGEVEIKNRMPSADEDDKQKKKQRRSGKIFKACKRILGL